MPLDLSKPNVRKELAAQIKADINAYCVATYDDGHRNHLGASLIGHKCSRHLWYIFRWCKHKQYDGRMYRLFQRGHREERWYTEYLRGIGFEVWTLDDNGKQFRIAAVCGHFGGSLDGGARAKPENKYGLIDPLLLEFKTHNTGTHWTKLLSNGVEFEKQQHFVQMSIYGKNYGIRYALYLNTNKNDDDLHVEIVQLNWRLAEESTIKAERVITATTPPLRLSDDPTFWECKHCDHYGICHNGEKIDVNCRSCRHAVPIVDGQWQCNMLQISPLPLDTIKKGCSHHLPLQ